VKGIPDAAALARLRRGMRLEGKMARVDHVRLIPSRRTRHAWLEIRLHQGLRRQIREMCFRIGHPVLRLKRIAYGPLRLGDLPPGRCRELTDAEWRSLMEAVKP